jgi:hypothetical protein
MATPKKQLATLLTNFAVSTVLGTESGFYKSIAAGKLPGVELAVLKVPTTAIIFREPTVEYLNHCYRSLILKNDSYVVEKFEAMTKLLKHSEICLLNIIAKLVTSIQKNIRREGLNISNYEAYLKSFEFQTDIICIYQQLLLMDKFFSHNCSGKPISEYDPTKPMFS